MNDTTRTPMAAAVHATYCADNGAFAADRAYCDMRELARRLECDRADLIAALDELLHDKYLADPINNDRMANARATLARVRKAVDLEDCGERISGTQNRCTAPAGHVGDHRCKAADVDARLARVRS